MGLVNGFKSLVGFCLSGYFSAKANQTAADNVCDFRAMMASRKETPPALDAKTLALYDDVDSMVLDLKHHLTQPDINVTDVCAQMRMLAHSYGDDLEVVRDLGNAIDCLASKVYKGAALQAIRLVAHEAKEGSALEQLLAAKWVEYAPHEKKAIANAALSIPGPAAEPA